MGVGEVVSLIVAIGLLVYLGILLLIPNTRPRAGWSR